MPCLGLRETFQLLDDPECNKLGRQTWVLITIIMTELLICLKFGWSTITKPLPRHIAMWWVLGATLLIVYTFVKELTPLLIKTVKYSLDLHICFDKKMSIFNLHEQSKFKICTLITNDSIDFQNQFISDFYTFKNFQ